PYFCATLSVLPPTPAKFSRLSLHAALPIWPGYTDSNTASFDSMLAFTERTFGLAPLAVADAVAYDYFDSFDFGQHPQPPIGLVRSEEHTSELQSLRHLVCRLLLEKKNSTTP